MTKKHNPYITESVMLLNNDEYRPYSSDFLGLMDIMEDASSPVNRKFQEKLYQSVLDKGHIDFGDIEKSRGDVLKYSGYTCMKETLDALKQLGEAQKVPTVIACANTVIDALSYIALLANVYSRGFTAKNDYVKIEYCTYVYTCVQATTAILYEFVDYIKRPDKGTIEITLRNTKNRADMFYFDQLNKFNNINKNMGIEYRKMLENSIDKGKNNFAGIDDALIIGTGALVAVALAIVPVTRSLIYHVYKARTDISNSLMLQAHFLEMNKTCVEANQAFTQEKKVKILKKQEGMRKGLLRMAEILKVKSTKSRRDTKKKLEKDNKELSLSSIQKSVDDAPLELI